MARLRVGRAGVRVSTFLTVAETILELSGKSLGNLTPLTTARLRRVLGDRVSHVSIGHTLRLLAELGILEYTGKSPCSHYVLHKSKLGKLTRLLELYSTHPHGLDPGEGRGVRALDEEDSSNI